MLPVYLSIEGVYSYQEKQEVDFTSLTEAGLFGIFGNVGSGKSTILEAISFALYGITERINKNNNRAYNMLNLKSNAACIEFEFYNFEGKKFRFVAQWKRKNKHFQETSSLVRLAYEWKDNEWMPLESNDGSLYTNLSYANFKRTIIIPQGQFREFLDLAGTERSTMMKEIFQLDRFDLGMKTSKLQRENNNRIENLKGALTGFESVSDEILTIKKQEYVQAKEQLLILKTECDIVEKDFKNLSEAKEIRVELEKKEKDFAELKLEEPKIIQLEKDLSRFEITQMVFKDLIAISQKLNKDKELLTYKIENLTSQKEEIAVLLVANEKSLVTIDEEHSQLEILRSQTEDIKLLIENKNNQQQLDDARIGIEKGTPYVAQAKADELKIIEYLSKIENDIEQLKRTKIDTTSLLAIENWYQENDRLIKEKQLISSKKIQFEEEIASLQKHFDVNNINAENWESQLQNLSIKLKDREQIYQQKETQLQVQFKLSEFAQHLHDGDECPLCGSLSHPNLMESNNLADQKQILLLEKEKINEKQSKLQQLYQLTAKISTSLQEKLTQLAVITNEIELNHQAIIHHEQLFEWKEFSSVDKTLFDAHKNKSKELEDNLQKTDLQFKNTRDKLGQAQQKVLQYENKLHTHEQNAIIHEKLIQQNERQLRVLKPNDVIQLSVEELNSQGQEINHKIQYIENEYKRLNDSITKYKTHLASISGQRKEAKEHFQQLINDLKEHQTEIASLLVAHDYNDLMEVQRELNKNISITEARQTIQDFKIVKHSLENQITTLTFKKENDNFNQEDYEVKLDLLPRLKQELELNISSLGAKEKELLSLQSEFEKKEQLLVEFEKLSVRKNNLTTIENLFRGAGFVNYVSSIHLQRLCEIANNRFHRLTKNQLSLSINKNNDFEVIDYLNNGYSRSVKTLSGGQSFQASLCLALALAENIQSLNKADKNFFFIDEGFGTQDAESIHTVFETLNYLHKENRIVGIISHVEELKERIPRTISIVNDPESGSKVFENL